MIYNVFISHSWSYGSNYSSLVNVLRQSSGFIFKDYSVPKSDPIHNVRNDVQLRQAIRGKMGPCSVVIVLAGVDATYSRWINEEIALAKKGFYKAKPIIAVRPRGNERISQPVRDDELEQNWTIHSSNVNGNY